MSIENALPDIPRAYTALAEWCACLGYIAVLPKRIRGVKFGIAVGAALAIQYGVQKFAAWLPLSLWMVGMLTAVIAMFAFVGFITDIPVRDVGYCCARAFVLAEFTASIGWQLYCYFFTPEALGSPTAVMFLAAVCGAVFLGACLMEMRHMPQGMPLHVRNKELWSAAAIALSAFLISNISFVYADTPFSGRLSPEIFYIRTLVDFCGFVMLYAQQEQRRENQIQQELESINNILHRQYEQYQQSRDSIDLINRKYHDLKHQITIIRNESNPEKKAAYLDELECGIQAYEAQNKTGNSVLDTVLTAKSMYCAKHNITLTCVADGTLLSFMDAMDICTIFGNALDNAIESVSKLADTEKRLIRVALYMQHDFVMIRFENYFESELKLENGLFATTKPNKNYHGYGIKSIRYTVEKYDGSVTIHTEGGWFVLRLLFPLKSE